MDAIHAGVIHGMYIMGENPAMSDPDAHHARDALAKLEHLVVQDLFLTETAFHADVVLPASAWPEKDGTVTNTNRQVQMGRDGAAAAGRGAPGLVDHPGDRPAASASTGTTGIRATSSPRWREAMPSLTSITWERLERESSVTYPCDAPDEPGQDIVFGDGFPTADGRGKLVPADVMPPDELPDADYPMVLTTGRQLEHWHTGAMTRRATYLDALEPEAVASLPPGHGAPGRRAGRADPRRAPGAARSSSRRASTARCPKACCSSPSATPRPRPTS